MKAITIIIMLALCLVGVLSVARPGAQQSVHAQQSFAEAWVKEFNPASSTGLVRAAAIAVDKAGNSYVAGLKSDAVASTPSDIKYDYLTIKYDSSGNQQWAAEYKGPGDSNDQIEAIAVDEAGNVYVTGESEAADETTNYVTIKYDASGVQQWIALSNGPRKNDSAKDIAVDKNGGVYVTGKSFEATGDFVPLPTAKYLTIKYGTDGNSQWTARSTEGMPALPDEARSIAVDGAGNVYVTGGSWGSDTALDYTTIKYDAGGSQKWVRRYNGPGSGVDLAVAVAVDASSNVYVTGLSIGSNSSADYATIKYNGNGDEQWVKRFNGTDNVADVAKDLVVDSSGNVYVTGMTNSHDDYEKTAVSDPRRDYATVKYDSAGEQKWVAIYDGPGKGADEAMAMDLDGSGNVYVTGQSVGAGASFDYATVKYDGAGAEQWAARFDGAAGKFDGASDIAVDGNGSVYVTGSSQIDTAGRSKIVTIKYTQSGTAAPGAVANVSAASYAGTMFASESIATAFGQNMATDTQPAQVTPLPTNLAGTTVNIKDSAGQSRLAPLFYVSPTQVNYLVPQGTANGTAEVTITSGAGAVSKGTIPVNSVGPGVFSADARGAGFAAALVLRVKSDGTQIYERVAEFDMTQSTFVGVPINLDSDTDRVFLILYGTGFRYRSSLAATSVKIGGQDLQVDYAGIQGDLFGLDQMNVPLPTSLRGRGDVDVVVTVDGATANVVKVTMK